jgi:hypothetical protein
MHATQRSAALILPLLLAACAAPYSETPVPSNFVVSKQLKLQTSEHWQIIADDVAKRISDVYQSSTPIWIKQDKTDSDFNRIFKQQLSTALVSRGLTILLEPNGSYYELDIQTSILRFAADRVKADTSMVPTALATGVWSVDHAKIAPYITRKDEGLTDGGLYANEFYWSSTNFAQGPVPQREIVIHSNLTNKSQYIISDTRSYYISDADDSLYQSPVTTYRIPLTSQLTKD